MTTAHPHPEGNPPMSTADTPSCPVGPARRSFVRGALAWLAHGQRERLHDLGCTYAQGYLFGRPAPPSAALPPPAA